MAEFVSMVIQDQALYDTDLPGQNLIDVNTLQQVEPYVGLVKYGDFAKWLGSRVEETILYINTFYWTGSHGVKGHASEDCGNNSICGAGMNMNSPFACALLFIGLAEQSSTLCCNGFGHGDFHLDFLSKAQEIAELYKGAVNFIDHCLSSNHTQYSANELSINISSNSYFWYTQATAAKTHNCFLHIGQDDIDWYLTYMEDPGHGAMDLWFARASYENQFAHDNLSQPYFTSTEMKRFKNTFTKNIYYTDNTGVHFHNNVDGTDNPSQGSCSPNCPPDLNIAEVLDWMPLYRFDESPGPYVYDILLNHVQTLLATPSLISAEGFLGLSEVVKAQWEKKCVNLSLFKRDLVYNQDFNIKNSLTVEPLSTSNLNSANSFADPIINTPDFIIENNVTSIMTAGEKVELKPGFRAKAGCEFRAYILTNLCSDGNENGRIANPENTLSTAGQKNILKQANALTVYPNPANDALHISTTISGETLTVKIMDILGNKISESNFNGNETTIDVSNLQSGIYFAEVLVNGRSFKAKFVKQ